MTVTIVDDGGSDDAVETLAETVEELVETVEELATEPEPEIVVIEPEGSPTTDMVVGVLLERVSALEERVDNISITADVALSVAEQAIETEPVVEVVDEEPTPEPDVPPETWKSRFHKMWFGSAT